MRSLCGEVIAQFEARHRRWVGAVTKPYFGRFWEVLEQAALGNGVQVRRPARGEFWRGMKFPSYFNRAAQTGVFSTVWKFFPSCLFPLAVHHAVPKHREDMEGNRPPHLSHLL